MIHNKPEVVTGKGSTEASEHRQRFRLGLSSLMFWDIHVAGSYLRAAESESRVL